MQGGESAVFYRMCKSGGVGRFWGYGGGVIGWQDVPCTRRVKDVVAGTDCVSAQAAEKSRRLGDGIIKKIRKIYV